MTDTPEVRLVMTCHACPEQYDAYIGNRMVGYLRLRHGKFAVEHHRPGGMRLYEANPVGDGIFEAHERDYHLRMAVAAIIEAENYVVGAPMPVRPPAPDSSLAYSITNFDGKTVTATIGTYRGNATISDVNLAKEGN